VLGHARRWMKTSCVSGMGRALSLTMCSTLMTRNGRLMATWKDSTDLCQETGVDYWTRFEHFRGFESYCLDQTGNADIADPAWALLPDLERAYAARSYSACFCLACAMIEIHLRRVAGLDGKLSSMLRTMGLDQELRWLLDLRNDIMHGNPNPFVQYVRMPAQSDELERLCARAFMAVHTIAAKVPRNAGRPVS